MSDRLKNKRILVTGGGTGIGRATVIELARQGAVVGIHYFKSNRSATQLRTDLVNQRTKADMFQADLTNQEEAAKLVADFVARTGGIDGLVNNAGDIVDRKKLEEMPPGFFLRVMAVNMNSAVMVTRFALPYLRASAKEGGATIVNVSSLAGRQGVGTGASAYCAAKGAIIVWTKAMARELAPNGIRVNAVAPGFILNTNFHEIHTPKAVQEKAIANIPLNRAGSPEDVARAIAFLASEFNGFITGANWTDSEVFRQAYEHNVPMKVAQCGKHKGKLPTEMSFLEVTPHDLIVSAVKKHRERKSVVVRTFNPTGAKLRGRISCYRKIKEARLLNLNEEVQGELKTRVDGSLSVEVDKHQIVTVELSF